MRSGTSSSRPSPTWTSTGLVAFYWEQGQREKAVEAARQGLQRAEGDKRQLREFLAERALEAAGRAGYLLYTSGLVLPSAPASRAVYAEQAAVVARLRRMWVGVLDDPKRWQEFGRELKYRHLRRPAFQEELARVIPDWNQL